MTVSTAYSPLTYNGNSATTNFSVTWPFFTGSLVVTAIDANGVETVKTINTHYTVSGGTNGSGLPSTGVVTMLVAPATGTRLRVSRATPRTQTSTWGENDDFPQATVEAALDKGVMISQELLHTAVDEITGDFIQLDSSGATDFWDAESHPLRNLADGNAASDAVTMSQLIAAQIGEVVWGSTGSVDNAILRADGTGGIGIQSSGVIIDDSDNVSGINDLTVDGDSNLAGFHSIVTGGTLYFGHGATLNTAAPGFQFESDGRTKVRYRSAILYDPGDTAEHAFYVAAGTPESPRPRGLTDGGNNEVGQNTAWFYHETMLAHTDDAPGVDASATLSNGYRTIAPLRLDSGSPNFTATKYVVGPSGYTDTKAFCLRFGPGVSSGSNPTLNINGWGAKAIKLSNGNTPSNNLWGPLTEIIVQYDLGSDTFKCRSNSDTSAGYTDRAAFSNPNYARSLLVGARFREQPSQTARPVNWFLASTRPEEVIPRDNIVVTDIGSVVAMGLGSYEDAPNNASWPPQYNYPGEMVSTGTDPMWTGNEFAGNWLHNAFTISGWGNFSAPAADYLDFAAFGLRDNQDLKTGFDIGYDRTNTQTVLIPVKAGSTSKNVTACTQYKGLPLITVAGHGYKRRQQVVIASVGGVSEVNGTRVIWPISADTFLVLGVRMLNSSTYTSGGTVTAVSRQPAIAFDNGVNDFTYIGGSKTNYSLRVTRNTNVGGNAISIVGVAASNQPTITASGDDTNISINVQPKGTGILRLFGGQSEALRTVNVVTGVNYVTVAGATTTNSPILSAEGSDTNINLAIVGKNTGVVRIFGGQSEALRTVNVSTGVNYLTAQGSATGNGVILGVDGSDSNVDLRIVPRGTGKVAINGTTGYARLDVTGGSIASQARIGANNSDEGMYLTSAAGDGFYVSGGGSFNGSSWVAKNANFSAVGGGSGTFDFYGDTGLTPGNTFSPTQRAKLTAAGNFKIGGTATRGTTEGTNQLVLFNGTAPAGTLTNGASFYAASGEMRVMDSAGNNTLLSPHDHETNEWIYHSIDTRNGKGLRIDMERMCRWICAEFGKDFVREFVVGTP